MESLEQNLTGLMIKFLQKLKEPCTDLLIFDTIFPNPISGFRFAEFTALLENFNNSKIIVNPKDYQWIGQNQENHNKDITLLEVSHPISFKKTYFGNVKDIKNAKLFYCVFLNNMIECLPILEKRKISFIFTLYPGGGFDTKNSVVIENLRKIIESKYFKGVIVTQDYTRKFLLDELNCPVEKVNFIFGGIIPQNSINIKRSKYFTKSETLKICFCAAKYTEKGIDKGYDIFINVAKELIKKKYNVHFSIAGGFSEKDIEVHEYSNYFSFVGYKKYEDLQKFFIGQDIIISPNRPFILTEGSFDGFPLGTVVEAALNGVIPIITDELKQNKVFDDGEIIITKPNAGEIAREIENLLANPKQFSLMGNKTQNKFREVYCNENQLNKRIDYLKTHIYDTNN